MYRWTNRWIDILNIQDHVRHQDTYGMMERRDDEIQEKKEAQKHNA